MPFDFQRARPLLQGGDLDKLFVEELGWEPCRQKPTLRASESDYALAAIAEKRGFIAWLCQSATGGLPEPSHSQAEDRSIVLGQSHQRKLLVVVHTERGDNIRIVSARRASRRERKSYEESN